MTPAQYQLCQLLHFCTYMPGSFEKRFARSLAGLAHDAVLTEQQADGLLQQAHRYRYQMQALIEDHVPDQAMRQTLLRACAQGRWEEQTNNV